MPITNMRQLRADGEEAEWVIVFRAHNSSRDCERDSSFSRRITFLTILKLSVQTNDKLGSAQGSTGKSTQVETSVDPGSLTREKMKTSASRGGGRE